ncbi:secretion protein HlyD [Cyanobium sp. PCC 7001]|uniref:efflux RND transporter periplasmic adaptor subunit n=1 Tax=Cyanobium sp. PCC 7001 TaxID=180281 RepID=UPI0001804E08|nr:efflux RND transporter periplasmic adaptor subunit [Cyanobium sp. PCC 7001]EDY39739.1 secretion protein HlyD [Cyanobium sp. PCC 7001]
MLVRPTATGGAGTVLAAGALLLTACAPSPPPPPRVVSVSAVPVATAPFQEVVDTIGTLEALEEVSLATRVTGRIERLLVREGQLVQQGQPILQLDQTQPRAQLAAAREERDNLCIDFRRFDFLAAKGAASVLQRDSFRARCLQANEDVKAREADLAFSNLRAPITGVVSDLEVKQGDVVQAGTTFTKVVRNDRLLMRIDIPAVQSARVKLGQPVVVRKPDASGTLARGRIDFVDPNVTASSQGLLVKAALPNPSGALRTGLRLQTLVELDRQILPAVPFAAVTQSSGQSFVFRVGTIDDLKRQPGKAPIAQLEKLSQETPATRFALQTPVKLGPLQNNSYAVLEGVTPGSQVITTNLLNLRHGTAVKLN